MRSEALVKETIEKVREWWAIGIKPDEVMSVSDWSDKFRILSVVASAEPGRWRTERTPYMKEIMNALSAESQYSEVVFLKGSQLGASESALNWIGYVVDMC